MTTTTMNTSKAWGVTALVTGIIGLLFILAPYFGLFFSIFAVVSSSLQNKRSKNGLSTTGKILGIIGIVVNSIMLPMALLVLVSILRGYYQ